MKKSVSIVLIIVVFICASLAIGNAMVGGQTIDTVSAATGTWSTNNYLKTLSSSVVAIPFVKTTTTYNVSVANSVTTINLVAVAEDSKATVVKSGDSNFIVGSNKITVKVTSESGAIRYYYVYVTRAAATKSSNNNLSSLSSSVVSIPFSASTTTYNVTVANSVTSLGLKATVADSKATTSISGDSNFIVGTNKITIKVTAEDGGIKNYYVNVTRNAKSSNANLKTLSSSVVSIPFVTSTTTYNVEVNKTVSSLGLTAQAEDSLAKVSITGDSDFIVGSNKVTIKVTAEDGTVKNYYVTITKTNVIPSDNSKLMSLTSDVASILFVASQTEYTVSVGNGITSLALKATAEDSKATVSINGDSNFVVGLNTVTVKVTSETGTATTYTIRVTRMEKASANLTSLNIQETRLDQKFNPDVFEYSTTIDYTSDRKLNLNYIASDPNATVTVTGNEKFVVGQNDVKITVKGEDGKETIYTVHVTMKAEKSSVTGNSVLPFVIGGIGLVLILLIVFFIFKRRKQKKNMDSVLHEVPTTPVPEDEQKMYSELLQNMKLPTHTNPFENVNQPFTDFSNSNENNNNNNNINQ